MRTISRTLIGIVAALLAVALVIFGVQNPQTVKIQFLTFSTESISLSLLVIGAVIMGAALMWLFGLWGAAQRSIRLMRDSKERSQLEARNKELDAKVRKLEEQVRTLAPVERRPEPTTTTKPTAKP